MISLEGVTYVTREEVVRNDRDTDEQGPKSRLVVTASAKVRSGFHENGFCFSGVVDGVTTQAIQLRMTMSFAQVRMTSGAAKLDLAGRGSRETENFLDVSVPVDMFRPRAVAGFAPGGCWIMIG